MQRKYLFICLVQVIISGAIGAQEVQIGNGTLTFEGKVASGLFWDGDDVPIKSKSGNPINQGSSFTGENGSVSINGADGKVYMWNESDTKTSLRAELTAVYNWGPVGFRARLRADDALSGKPDTVVSRYAYGWVHLFKDSLKLTGGFIDLSDNVWGTLGDGDWDLGGNGLRIEFKPFKIGPLGGLGLGELNLGAFFMVPNEKNPNTLHYNKGGVMPEDYGAGNVTPENVLKETAFGLTWTHPAFYLRSQLQLDSKVDGEEILDAKKKQVWSGAEDEMHFMFGVGLTVLTELVLTAEGNFEGLGNWAARGKGDLRQTLQYTLERVPVPYLSKVFFGMKARELLWGYDLYELCGWDFELAPWMQFKPFIGYKASNNLSTALEFGFGSGYLVGKHPSKGQEFVNESSNFYIKPSLSFAYNNFSLKAWYKFSNIEYSNLSEGTVYADRKRSNLPKNTDELTFVDAIVQQQIAIEFEWVF